MVRLISKLLNLNNEVLVWTIRFSKPHTARILVNFFISAFFALNNVLFAWLLKQFTDIASGSSNKSLLLVIGIAAASLLINGIARYVYRMNRTMVINKINYEVKAKVITAISKASYSEIDKKHSADYLTRLTSDYSRVGSFIIDTFNNTAQNLFKVLFSYIYLFYLSPLAALVITCMACVLPMVNKAFQNILKNVQQEQQELNSTNTIFLQEYLEGLRIIRVLRLPAYFLNKLRGLTDKLLLVEQKNSHLSALQSISADVCETSMFFTAMLLGAYLSTKGYMTAGSMMAFIQLLNWIIWPFTSLAGIGIQLQNELIPAERVYNICRMECYIPLSEMVQCDSKETAISFENVDFSYNPEVPILQNLSFAVKDGERVGLVGMTGSGKSTIIKLIMGEYRSGQNIRLFGKTINGYPDEEIYDMVSYIPQDPWLFATSIYENIRIGNINAEEQEVYEAARQAHADEFINQLPEGYNTSIWEKGNNLSGGQKQRIALARAFLKPFKILILDESTSAVDRLTEQYIQEAVWKLSKNKTVIIINHRLETMKFCDRVFFLDNGRVTENGSHDDLIKLGGGYKRLYEGLKSGFQY